MRKIKALPAVESAEGGDLPPEISLQEMLDDLHISTDEEMRDENDDEEAQWEDMPEDQWICSFSFFTVFMNYFQLFLFFIFVFFTVFMNYF